MGVGSGYLIVSVAGFFLLIPALVSSNRRAPTPVSKPRTETKRIIPQAMAQANPPEPVFQVSIPAPAPMPQGSFAYSPSLFPNSMFPGLTQLSNPSAPASSVPQKEQEPKRSDDLLEIGVLLAVFRLAFG